MTVTADISTELTTEMFIDGTWTATEETFDDLNPTTGELLAKIANGSAGDVDRAVRAARRAFDGQWGDFTGAARGGCSTASPT